MSDIKLTDIMALVEKAHQDGIKISFDDSELIVQLEKEKEIDGFLLKELKNNKEPLIEYLKKCKQSEKEMSLKGRIRAKARPPHIPLSYSQERLWFIDQLEGSVQYHMPAVLRLKGKLIRSGLSHALKTIVARHEVLRTVVVQEGGEASQHIQDKAFDLTVIEEEIYKKDQESLESYIRSLIATPFDLSKDLMLRSHLIVLGESEHILVVTLHHIASDGWSTGIIVKELAELYESYIENRPAQLSPLKIQYADYALWQREYLSESVLSDKLAYWRGKLEGVATLNLPTDYVRPVVTGVGGGRVSFTLDRAISDQVRKLSYQHDTTLFMTLLSAFKVLLYRYSNQSDICVGSPISGRTRQEVEDLIGFFVNTLPLRSKLQEDQSFTSLMHEVKQTTLGAYDHQDIPFEKIVEAVVKERDLGQSPLFQVMFILENALRGSELRLGDVVLTGEFVEHSTAQFDLTMLIVEQGEGLYVNLVYRSDLFKEETIVRMSTHYQELIKSIVKTPEAGIGSLSILSPQEEHQLLKEFNNSSSFYPDDKTFIDLFCQQAVLRPDSTAILFEGGSLTYKELDERSSRVGHYLKSIGVKADTLVPICIERSLEMLIGLLGILKAGGAFVPIDPDYPSERINYMISDSGGSIVLSSRWAKEKILKTARLNVIELDNDAKIFKDQPFSPLSIARPHDLAYVIYTSGSTGKPKGVMIEHRSLLNFLLSMKSSLSMSSSASILAVTTYCFDISYLELYLPLLSGGRVILASKETSTDGFKLKEALSSHRPSHMQATPASWQMLLESGWSNDEGVVILTGGEALQQGLKDSLVNLNGAPLWNMYGPTEATIWATSKLLGVSDKITIGKPIDNTEAYIVDSACRLVPVGVSGQLCIGGVQLARGYLNREDLSREKFISNPFKPGQRLYYTGDVARWLSDGAIEYQGRIDDQVKIRGYRIELGEIESAMLESKLAAQAVVVARTDHSGYKRLIGYVVPGEGFDQGLLFALLKEKLPAYMVPSVIMELEKLPLTPNGKVDKKSLPDPQGGESLEHEYAAPRTETEEILSGIWQELLGVDRIGVNDNFFTLGGNSLMAMRLISSIDKILKVKISVKTFFQLATIASLARHIRLHQNASVSIHESLETIEL